MEDKSKTPEGGERREVREPPKLQEESSVLMAPAIATDSVNLITLIPQWFFALTGLVYASGCMVAWTSLDRFGLRDVGSDVWRGKYFQIGILCLAVPVSLNITILTALHFARSGRSHLHLFRVFPVGLLLLNLEVVVFATLLLSRRGKNVIPPDFPLLVVILIATIAVLAATAACRKVLKRLVKKAGGAFASFSLADFLRWLALVPIGWFDYRLLRHSILPEMVADRWMALAPFLLLTLFLGFFPFTLNKYASQAQSPWVRRGIWATGLCIAAPVYYCLVLLFTYGIFPYIRESQGGGDFAESPREIIFLKEPPKDLLESLRKDFFDEKFPQQTKPVIVIDQNAAELLVVHPKPGSQPVDWRAGAVPQVLSVNRGSIDQILHLVKPRLKIKQILMQNGGETGEFKSVIVGAPGETLKIKLEVVEPSSRYDSQFKFMAERENGVEDGALPEGLSLEGNMLAGQPKAFGVWDGMVEVENAGGSDIKPLRIEIR